MIVFLKKGVGENLLWLQRMLSPAFILFQPQVF